MVTIYHTMACIMPSSADVGESHSYPPPHSLLSIPNRVMQQILLRPLTSQSITRSYPVKQQRLVGAFPLVRSTKYLYGVTSSDRNASPSHST